MPSCLKSSDFKENQLAKIDLQYRKTHLQLKSITKQIMKEVCNKFLLASFKMHNVAKILIISHLNLNLKFKIYIYSMRLFRIFNQALIYLVNISRNHLYGHRSSFVNSKFHLPHCEKAQNLSKGQGWCRNHFYCPILIHEKIAVKSTKFSWTAFRLR